MTDAVPDPLAAAVFVVLAMSTAGLAHVAWLKSGLARGLAVPIDGGRTFRGRRIFGDNKMLRGFAALPPAAAVAFAGWSALWPGLPDWVGRPWPLAAPQYALLGFACGLAFMLAELPNSFAKRQLGIGPGQAAARPGLRGAFFVIDRCDSVIGVLVVASLLVPVPLATWGWVLLLGPCLHAAFSVALHRLGVKARAL